MPPVPFLGPIASLIGGHVILLYIIMFVMVIWEGEITLIIAGILVHIGVFSLPLTLFLALIAAITKTIVGYRLGSYLGRTFPNSSFLKYMERKVFFFLPRFRERPFWSIVVSKFIYGVNNLTLVFAGYVNADFNMYCLAEGTSSFFWLGGMFGLGYFFSASALAFSHTLRSFALRIALFIIGFMIIQKIINLVIEVVEEWGVDPNAKL